MFQVRFTYLPNCAYLIKERWAKLPHAFETDVRGEWRLGKGSLATVSSYCRKNNFAVLNISEAMGQYTITFGGSEDAKLQAAEGVWNAHQEARWA